MTLAIIQARMGSTRLPNKVLLPVKGMTMLAYEVERIRLAKTIDRIVVATTDAPADDRIVEACRTIGVDNIRGSESDVLDRYVQCARAYPEYKTIVRLTGDCPVIDPAEIDHVVSYFIAHDLDYACNNAFGKETYPDGLDVEVFSRDALERAYREARMTSEREHVTLYIKQSEWFRRGYVTADVDFSHFRLTLDEPADYEVLRFVIEHSDIADGYLKYISLLTKNLDVMEKNMRIMRNEGLKKSLAEDRLI